MFKPTVVTIVGTRPEIIRLSRVIALLDELTNHVLVHTGQNSNPKLSDVFFDDLEIRKPDHYLGINTESLGQTLGETLIKTEQVLNQVKPNAVLILGDTNSAVSAIIAKRLHIPVYHMEAGNRSFDANVPEETNRRLVDHVADFNLAYTEHARRNLLAEGIHPRQILVSGSPIKEIADFYFAKIEKSNILKSLSLKPGEYFLVSAHRQENVDSPKRLDDLLETLSVVHKTWNLPVLMSTHPRTKNQLEKQQKFKTLDGVTFHEPFGFLDYNKLQKNAKCVISDSGTISEESLILGFPAITIRDSMERPEALDVGGIVMTGLKADEVLAGISIATNSSNRRTIELPLEYQVSDCSNRVVNFMFSTMTRQHEWLGIRNS
jgi:UDP-N-acetylglucosamine 2-epimerase (non-hydrolysing)